MSLKEIYNLEREISCTPDAAGHCVTCSDEALPARILQIDHAQNLALVAVGDDMMEVDVTLVDEVKPGDLVLVHGGVAIASLGSPDPEE